MNVDHKSLETVLLIAICRQLGKNDNNFVSNVLILPSFIVLTFLIVTYMKCLLNIGLLNMLPKQSKTRATKNN